MPSVKTGKTFRIQLSELHVVVLCVLGCTCLVISFYMGLVTGKSLRDPAELSVSQNVGITQQPEKLSNEDLSFFEMDDAKIGSSETEDLTNLKARAKQLQDTTREITGEQPAEAIVVATGVKGGDSLNPSGDVKKDTPPAKTTAPAKEQVEPPPVSQQAATQAVVSDGSQYTVQVFTSSSRETAEKLVEKLKQSGYANAFIHTFASDKTKLYRVRVGRMDKTSAETLAFKLRKLDYIDSVQVTRI
ncbi:MAG: SPOR domain-containing protein [SAR324 cluster bacterium]|nr:SPOR domain-containing protein [SAR324 cluster bacterium]